MKNPMPDLEEIKNKIYAIKKHRDPLKMPNENYDIFVFPQTWGSTGTAFDVTAGGQPTLSGCAMTLAYTTVFHDAEPSGSYYVFIDNRPCYVLDNATDVFLKDLENKSLKSLSEAKKYY